MPAVEEVGKVDERAAELIDDIGRRAEANVGIEVDRIAKAEAIAFVGDFVRRPRDRRIEMRRFAEIGEVERLERRQPLARAVDPRRDSGRRAIGQPVVERLPVAGRDAEDRGILRIFGEHLLGHPLQLPGKDAVFARRIRNLASREKSRRRDAPEKFPSAQHDRHRPLLIR